MLKRRGNPDWGKPGAIIPTGPTEFEKMAKRLKLSTPEYCGSKALKEWARQNRTQRYVPTELLKAWGIDEATDF